MKKIFMVMVVPLLILSCTPEQDHPAAIHAYPGFMKSGSLPYNSNNPYDNFGSLRNRIFDSLQIAYPSSKSLEEIVQGVNTVSGNFPEFNALKSANYSGLTVETLSYYLQFSGSAENLGETLPLTTSGSAFVSFTEGLLSRNDNPFEDSLSWITSFETALISSKYPAGEKEILLTISSIERYALYRRKKPKDRDWDLLIGNIAATSQGASIDAATAIIFSVAFEAASYTIL